MIIPLMFTFTQNSHNKQKYMKYLKNISKIYLKKYNTRYNI